MTARSHFELLDDATLAAILAMLPAGSIPLASLAALTASRIVASDASGILTVNAAGTANRLAYWGSAGALAVNAALTQNRVVIGDANGLPTPAAAITADRALISDANGVPTHSTITAAQLATGLGAWVYLSTQTASASATIDFTGLGAYSRYRVEIEGLQSATDSVVLGMRMDTDNGASFDAGAGVYGWCLNSTSGSATTQDTGTNADAMMVLIGNSAAWQMGTGTGEHWHGSVTLMNLGASNLFPMACWEFTGLSSTPTLVHHEGSGFWGNNGAAAMNAIRFLCGSGNIATGTFRLYGLKTS